MNNSISVYVADDHPVVRKGMARLLKTFSRVGDVQEAPNGKQLIDLLSTHLADVVIMDLEMPTLGGIEAAKVISNRFPSVKILILTLHVEDVFVRKLLDIGVHGFLNKSAEPEEIEKALYAVADKDFYRNAIIDNAVRKSSTPKHETYAKLSAREIEILLLICDELAPGEISSRLQISEKTFFAHRANILEKTGARSNVGLLKFALSKGLAKN